MSLIEPLTPKHLGISYSGRHLLQILRSTGDHAPITATYSSDSRRAAPVTVCENLDPECHAEKCMESYLEAVQCLIKTVERPRHRANLPSQPDCKDMTRVITAIVQFSAGVNRDARTNAIQTIKLCDVNQ
ncbi:hypothetical protein PHBOTO_001172 [Pseudozyma hubeiensis]|nr:hypothetical protein PHBOTO_001172 [Pseudozyma hubeiensis]